MKAHSTRTARRHKDSSRNTHKSRQEQDRHTPHTRGRRFQYQPKPESESKLQQVPAEYLVKRDSGTIAFRISYAKVGYAAGVSDFAGIQTSGSVRTPI